MQLLPPKQRVAVVLRDVLGWSAREVAELLEDSVPPSTAPCSAGVTDSSAKPARAPSDDATPPRAPPWNGT
jgi:RNA polymerase sigma-70 factor (ECF subfamily)